MGLSRLENFLKSTRGTILYVDPNSLDSTDSIENSGNSLTRPFKTIQRALIEAARFSYQRGLNNDRFNKTTILLYPGDHLVDNRPGYIPDSGTFRKRGGETGLTDLVQWDLETIFDIANPDNPLYKLNSVYGGVIVPRGTSIVGLDLRKTKIRPTYVPNPENNNIERSCIFRTTGGCYFWQFTILDSDPNGTCYKDYTSNLFVPNFSHHKLSVFEYADGVNDVVINDDFISNFDAGRTDLDMYYEKVGIVYGESSGREIPNDYPSTSLDIQPVIDEYRIVGSTGASVGITSIKSGDGITGTNTVTVTLTNTIEGLSVDSPIQISGVTEPGYDGQYVISSVLNDTEITYKVQNIPDNFLPTTAGATLNIVVDTVTSASPYIFNCSLRSVYGMCGLLADGDKATGFKSMVVAQYTGIGLQKDDNAFVKYNSILGEYRDSTTLDNLGTNSRSKFKPDYENFHIKATNDAFLQLVSVFAIGYAQHFVTENGGDIALNNSNSNFGAKSLVSSGFKRSSFAQDDYGYITHIIPPKEIESETISIEFSSIDVGLTTSKSAGAGTTDRLYLYNETNQDLSPKVIFDGYNIGAKQNEQLNIQIYQSGILTSYSSRVVMPCGPYNSTQSSSEKVFTVGKNVNNVNLISSNTLTLTENHSFINGETIRIISDDGNLPDGLQSEQIYYVITRDAWSPVTSGISSSQIRIAKTLSDAINGSVTGNAIQINSKGGTLSVVSRVSDKKPGDIGHPVQWDPSGNWYLNVDTQNNQIYNQINSLGTSGLGDATSRTYVTRNPDNRSLIDTLYRVRYVLPKNSSTSARPPIDGFILQESNNILGSGSVEISQLYNSIGSITSNSTYLRNPRFIANASWLSNTVTITTEKPHNLKVGDQVEIVNILPEEYNGTYSVASIVSAKQFTYSLSTNPGTFLNNTSIRDANLPYFKKKKYNKTYQVYRSEEITPYVSGVQDGVYHLTLINVSNYPTVSPFGNKGFAQPIENLYPQIDLDNINSDPNASNCHSLPDTVGQVVLDDPKNSITKETIGKFIVGYGITNIVSSNGNNHTIYTTVDHGLSGITSLSIVSGGSNYGSSGSFSGDLYNARLVGFAGSTTGENATAKITITSGSITAVNIIDGGSAYGIGNTLTVVGVATTTSHVIGVVRVESVFDNINDSIKISGVSSASYSGYNTLYRISSISTGQTKQINVVSSNSISPFLISGLGANFTSNAGYIPTGKTINISTFTYDSVSGLATVGFTTSHGFRTDNKIRISGANESSFNGDFIVKKINSSVGTSSIVINVGASATTSTVASGTLYAYRPTLTSYGGDLLKDTENVSGRLNYIYDGITTTLGSNILSTDSDSTNLTILNAVSLGFNLGDYLLIDNEIFRIKTAVTSNTISIFRSVLGSPRETHYTGSVVRKIKVLPVELRRNSIIRASGHTFEYLGFGPGNYSTSLPDKQDRVLTNTEKFLSQATKTDGGIVVYTGMNSDGDFFVGNKKINSSTGKEESYDTPIPTNTGEKNRSSLINITDTQKIFVENSIKVEGGKDKNSLSEFNGPVVFNNKVTSNSDIEANSILIQGEEEVSRKISISNQKPVSAGNYGDIKFNSTPIDGSSSGWIYTTDNQWKSFGFVNNFGYGIGISSNGNYVGFSTLLNITGTGITITAINDTVSGITTLNFNTFPVAQTIGISSGISNTFVGLATQINFIGYGVSVTTNYDSTLGIATVLIDGSSITGGGGGSGSPGLPSKSIQYNNSGSFGGVSVFTFDDVNNTLNIQGSTSNSLFKITQTGSGNALEVEDQLSDTTPFVISNSGSVGVGSATPSAQLDIFTSNQPAINILSTSGSGNIVRINNTNGDITPFIIDTNGNVGINTITASGALDVTGTTVLVGELRLYETDRSNYIGLQAPSLASNRIYTLPDSYGTNGQVLTSNGAGGLSWATVSTSGGAVSSIVGGTGISISNGTGPTVTVTNTGITDVVAGNNITVTKIGGSATISVTSTGVYPFTTRGFSIPI